MALDLYSPCPCGSGKKFKWCCQPIHVEIDKAFRQEADGQIEAALRTMEQVTIDHPANPEAWGRKAELLYNAGRAEDAENALQKAFDISPNYPFGYLLRGSFRRAEGRSRRRTATLSQGGRLFRSRREAHAVADLCADFRLRDEVEPSIGGPGGRAAGAAL